MSLPKPARCATCAESSVSSSATSVELVAANANRIGLTVHNNSTQALYLRPGSDAATTSAGGYQVKIAADGYWEMDQPIWTGAIQAIWASANGGASVTEKT